MCLQMRAWDSVCTNWSWGLCLQICDSSATFSPQYAYDVQYCKQHRDIKFAFPAEPPATIARKITFYARSVGSEAGRTALQVLGAGKQTNLFAVSSHIQAFSDGK